MSIRERYAQLCSERDAIEARIAPFRAELRQAADLAEEYRVKAIAARIRLDEARGADWFDLKREIGALARVLPKE